jgi:hypothetical protein
MYKLLFLAVCFAGCASDHNSVRDRQDDALKDPMNYSPDTAKHNDITGGGTMDLKKDSLKKDFNSVFNP